MKTIAFLFVSMGLLLSQLQAAPSFTITPNAISNTYAGSISLQMTGLFTNESVVVRKYVDLNTNGTVDSTDFFLQQFQVTDQGGASLIGGQTNITIPYDTDTTKGSITVVLTPPVGGIAHLITGKFLYVFSSPSNHFTAVTNIFSVTNAGSQTISGTVVSNSTPIPYATVLVGYANNGLNPFTGAIANASGNYSVTVPPGTYEAVAFKSNYMGAPAGPFTVNAGGSVVTNLSLFYTTTSVSGKIADSSSSGGIPGLLVVAQGNGLGVGTTDVNGLYSVPVLNNNQWKIGGDSRSWNFAGYVQSNNSPRITVTNTSLVGFNISYPKASAMVYGSVVDGSGNPLPGVRLYGQNNSDNSGPYQGNAVTDASGNYSMGLMPGSWDVEIDLGELAPSFTNYVFPTPSYSYNNGGSGLTLSSGTAIKQKFVALSAAHKISGYLRDGSSVGIPNIQITASATINSTNYSAQSLTDGTGFYSINVPNGSWSVTPNCCDNCDSGLPSIYQCPNSQQVTIANNNQTANFTATRATLLSGKAVDYLGNPLASVNMVAWGTPSIYSAQTDSSGNFTFGLPAGNYNVGVDPSASILSSSSLVAPFVNVTINDGIDQSNLTLVCRHVTGTLTISITNSTIHAGVSGVGIQTSCNVNNTNYLTDTIYTDASGKANLPVFNGTWLSLINCTDLYNQNLTCPTNNQAPVNVTGATASMNFLVQGCGLQIVTTNLPVGTNGFYYDNSLVANGCYPPFTWTYVSGTIPDGLTLNGNGELYGTPDVTGNFNFTVQLQDTNFNTTTTNVSVTINAAAQPLQVTTFALPDATNGLSYSAFMSASGGTPPYWWHIESTSQPLPAGLTLNTNGTFTGTCTAAPGTYYFYPQVFDSLNASNDTLLSITVDAQPLLIVTASLPNGNVSANYSNALVATGGQTPYFWSLALGSASLPGGLTLDNTGLISGTPTNAGTFPFKAQVNDNFGYVTNKNLAIIINPRPMLGQPLRLSPTQFQLHLNGSVGQNYSLQYSTTLSNWNTFFTTNPTSTDATILDSSATNGQRAYRALIGP